MTFRRNAVVIAPFFLMSSLLLMSSSLSAHAHTTTIAVSGASADGIPAATWNSFSTIRLNNAGEIAFSGTLEHDGSITATNDAGVWLVRDDSTSLLAQTGAADAPGASGAQFAEFGTVLLSETGEVAVRGNLAVNSGVVTETDRLGVWLFTDEGDSLIARTGTGGVPGVPNTFFVGFPTTITDGALSITDGGRIALFGKMQFGTGGVFTNSDVGLWSYSAGASTLIAREGIQNVPDILHADYKFFSQPTINASNQLAVLGSLYASVNIPNATALGLWRYDGPNGDLIARIGVGNVPGMSSVDFSTFDPPRINASGQVVFSAGVSDGTRGIWSFTENTGALVASAVSAVPDVPGAGFAEYDIVALNDSGQILVTAELEPGVGGITAADNEGLWLLNGDDSLVARTGSGNVPGVPTANFAGFLASALNEAGQVAFAAELELGVGGVDSTNDTGIWLVDPTGESWLVARKGDQLAGRTIASLDFAGDDVTQSNGFNDSGELAFQANFINGDSGLFLFRPFAADFDRSGNVDSDDFSTWQSAFSSSSSADADLDDDSDGADFLVWQREFGSGGPTLPILSEVPEPASLMLLSLATLVVGANRRNCHRP